MVGLAVSSLCGVLVASVLARSDKIAFETHAGQIFETLQMDMTSANDVLFTLRRFIELDEATVSRRAFQEFAKQTRLRAPALRDSGFAPRVTNAERDGFEAAVRQTGVPDFVIRQPQQGGPLVAAPRKDVYYPILFPDPVEVAPAVMGLDLSFESGRRNAIARAIATNQPAATPPINIVTAAGKMSGFMSFLPVFKTGSDTEPVGLTYGVFEIAPMLSKILDAKVRAAGLNVLVFESTNKDQAIFSTPPPDRNPVARCRAWTRCARPSTGNAASTWRGSPGAPCSRPGAPSAGGIAGPPF